MKWREELETVIAELEAGHGPIPKVESGQALYEAYRRWSMQRGKPMDSAPAFARTLAHLGYVPVRLPDGSLGFLGIALKTSTPAPTTRIYV